MKVFLVLTLAVMVRGTAIRYVPAAGIVETGDSAQFRSEDNLGNYNFGYNEDHTSGGSFRREAGDAYGNVAGSYGLRDADGRLRIVNYVADDTGFRADIKTNEPGVEPKDPADVAINKGSAIVVESAAPVAIVAPAPVSALTIEQVPVAAVPVAKSAHVFPAPVAAPVAKTHTTTVEVTNVAPAVAAFPVGKSASVFPAPLAVPVAKTHTTAVEVAPAPIVAAPVPIAKSAYAFPAPVAAPVAKTHYTTVDVAPAPIVAAPVPVAKNSYVFPAPLAAPVAKTQTTTVEVINAAPAVPAPVAVKSGYAFPPPAAVPVAKTAIATVPAAVAVAEPLTYTSHVAIPATDYEPLAIEAAGPALYANPIAIEAGAPALTYASPIAIEAGAPALSYGIARPAAPLSSHLAINHLALASPAHYTHPYYGPGAVSLKSSGIRYAGIHSPWFHRFHSPAVSVVGASAYLNPYHYNGITYVKK